MKEGMRNQQLLIRFQKKDGEILVLIQSVGVKRTVLFFDFKSGVALA